MKVLTLLFTFISLINLTNADKQKSPHTATTLAAKSNTETKQNLADDLKKNHHAR